MWKSGAAQWNGLLNVYERHPEFKAYFDRVMTSEDFAESKPHPDCYLKGAAYFGVEPEIFQSQNREP